MYEDPFNGLNNNFLSSVPDWEPYEKRIIFEDHAFAEFSDSLEKNYVSNEVYTSKEAVPKNEKSELDQIFNYFSFWNLN